MTGPVDPVQNPEATNTPVGLLLGAHFSIAGGLHRALGAAQKYGCPVLQLFTQNPSTWRTRRLTAEEIDLFRRVRQKWAIQKIASHASYLINPASPEDGLWKRSRDALADEMVRSAQLGIEWVVLHPGSHKGSGEAEGIERIAAGINEVFAMAPDVSCRLLLETTAGQGDSIGWHFAQLAAIRKRIRDTRRIGICLDTGHIFAAGYDIRTPAGCRHTLQAFERELGLENLFWIHLNDSKVPLSSRVDRHEHIGDGCIGRSAFAFFINDLRLAGIPKILETPKRKGRADGDRINLALLRSLKRR